MKKIYFITGSQHLYGPETLQCVRENAGQIVKGLNESSYIPVTIEFREVVSTPESITNALSEADTDHDCIGIIAWMHTFSPAKMWIKGLKNLSKPLCHLHTQFNAEIPWGNIDMDFMNLNQSAHGDREFGYIMTRMRLHRKVVTGHWQNADVHQSLDTWSRVAMGWNELQNLKVARIGDNMREVAVTEGDKVEAQQKFGFSVNGYDTSDITKRIPDLKTSAIQALLEEYDASYFMADNLKKGGSRRESLEEAAKIELALRNFLQEGNFHAFTDTFENLGEFRQLPGIAVQRLMNEGYGFGAEGDWKTAALLRAMKVMGKGLKGGTSFMEDYTYHFSPKGDLVLGAHMLEICPSIAATKPSCEVHPLGIGGKEDPVRLIFNAPAGNALNASLIDIGNRFRLLVNEVEVVEPLADLPNLPVARALWNPMPNLNVAASAWILSGGAHHTVFTQALSTEFMEDFAEMAGIELLVIDKETKIRQFKDQLHSNEAYYHLFNKNM